MQEMDREGGDVESEFLSISSFSPFPLHFLIPSPFSRRKFVQPWHYLKLDLNIQMESNVAELYHTNSYQIHSSNFCQSDVLILKRPNLLMKHVFLNFGSDEEYADFLVESDTSNINTRLVLQFPILPDVSIFTSVHLYSWILAKQSYL